jgi:nucleoside-specific outer membrane channel protein Tsx
MTRAHLRALVVAALALAAAPAAFAQGFSTTNVQLLYGTGFKDPLYDASGKPMQTTTVNHFDAFGWGDSFFFADLYRADFGQGGKDGAKAYAEWHPRVFVNQLLKQKKTGIPFVRNWGLAGEINHGEAFYAYLAGVGVDLEVPRGFVLGANVYYRYDRFYHHEWQVSPFWTVPFALGKVPLQFTGFVDVNGAKDAGGKQAVEIWAQPELLADVLAPFGGPANRLWVGVEWWYHYAPYGGPTTAFFAGSEKTTSVPQAMVQWTIY